MALYPFSIIYLWITKLRNFLYNVGLFKTKKLDVPVISIGNITAGGTGKTPFTVALARYLIQRGLKPGIVTRGYKKQSKGQRVVSRGHKPRVGPEEAGDEAFLIAKNCQACVIANPNRYFAGLTASKQFNCNVIIADDGFQHRRLARDIDIVLWDSNNSPEKALPLPTGYLREDIKSINRADFIVFTRAKQIPEDQSRYFQRMAPMLKQYSARLLLEKLIKIKGCEEIPLERIENKSILAFCGLGNPDQFFRTIDGLSPRKIKTMKFNDHHRYSSKEFDKIMSTADRLGVDYIITTEKDLYNFPDYHKPDERILVLKADMDIDPILLDTILGHIS